MASAVIGALRVVLGLDSAAFESGLTDAQKQLSRAGRDIEKLGAKIAGVGAVMSVGLTAPLLLFAKKSVEAFDESAKSAAALDQVLRTMGYGAGFSAKQLAGMAAELQKASTFDDDEILGKVTTNLLTFGQIHGEVFKRAQQVTVDMATRLGEDLQGATIRVGKALNDPVAGLKALTKVGVTFTEQQKDQIKAMVAVGDVAGAQKLILRELEREFGGQAAAMAKTAQGQMEVAKHAFGDAMEDIGKTVRQLMPDIAKAITAVAKAFQSIPESARPAVIIAAAVVAALGPIVTVGGGLVATFGAVIGVLGKVGPLLAPMAGNVTGLAAAFRVLGASVLFFGAWAIAIAAVAGAFALLTHEMFGQVPASKEARKEQELLNTAVTDYETAARIAAAATGKAREEALKDAAVKKEQARQTIAAAKAKLAEAQASLIQAAADEATARQISGSEGGIDVVGVASQMRANHIQADIAALTTSIAAAEKGLGQADAILNAGPPKQPPATVTDPTGKGAKGRKGVDPSKAAEREAEMLDMRRQFDLERQITEAEAIGDEKHAQALRDQLFLMERVAAWRRTGLTDVGALLKAEEDLTAEQAKRDFEAKKAANEKLATDQKDLQKDVNDILTKQAEQQERLAWLRLQEELDLARIEGDPERVAALERQMEIARRIAEYREAGLDPIRAAGEAVGDANAQDTARTRAFWRDTLKSGIREAMDGDLKEFGARWFKDAASRGLENALNKLSDLLMNLFKRIDWGSLLGKLGVGGGGGTGSSIWSSVGKAITSAFTGYASGGSFMVGGAGGVDKNFVGFRATRGERVTVETPEQQANGVRQGWGVFAPVYNISTPDDRGFRRSQRQILNEERRAMERGWA